MPPWVATLTSAYATFRGVQHSQESGIPRLVLQGVKNP
jgi:hypothetical protein